jgi:hypothetical protein
MHVPTHYEYNTEIIIRLILLRLGRPGQIVTRFYHSGGLPNSHQTAHMDRQTIFSLINAKSVRETKQLKFSLEMDSGVLGHPEALVIGSISSNNNDNALNLVPFKFKKWTDIMITEAEQRLPSHKPYNHTIDLQDGQHLPWGPVYPLSETELEVLRHWLKNMMATRKIPKSKSPGAAPILFVPNAHGRGLRLCVDYRGINKITIANRYPLLFMSELQDRVIGSRIFTKIDLKNGYYLIRIKEEDKWKTAFHYRYGLYEF